MYKKLFGLCLCVGMVHLTNAQNEVLTKVDGGASWLTGYGGIYSGDGTTPSDVDVTVIDNTDCGDAQPPDQSGFLSQDENDRARVQYKITAQ